MGADTLLVVLLAALCGGSAGAADFCRGPLPATSSMPLHFQSAFQRCDGGVAAAVGGAPVQGGAVCCTSR